MWNCSNDFQKSHFDRNLKEEIQAERQRQSCALTGSLINISQSVFHTAWKPVVCLCVRTLRGVSAHVYAWYHWGLQNKQWHEMSLLVLTILGKVTDLLVWASVIRIVEICFSPAYKCFCPSWLWNLILREYAVQLSHSVPLIPSGQYLNSGNMCCFLFDSKIVRKLYSYVCFVEACVTSQTLCALAAHMCILNWNETMSTWFKAPRFGSVLRSEHRWLSCPCF